MERVWLNCEPCRLAVENAATELYRRWPSAVQPVEEREATYVWRAPGMTEIAICEGHARIFRRFAGRVDAIVK